MSDFPQEGGDFFGPPTPAPALDAASTLDDGKKRIGDPTTLLRPCPACREPVHVRAKECKKCGGPNPWKDEAPSTQGAFMPAPVMPDDESLPPHIASKGFTHFYNDVTVKIAKDTVLTSQPLLRSMLVAKQPIVPVSMADDIVCCPHCERPFSLTLSRTKAS